MLLLRLYNWAIMLLSSLIVAHRGYAPPPLTQNSLDAFKLAVDLGAKAIEFDIRMTADRQLVVFHDPVFWNGKFFKRISKATLGEFREFYSNTRAPLLETVLKEIPDTIKLFIEIKPSPFPDIVLKNLKDLLPEDRNFLILSYKQHILKLLQKYGFPAGFHYINPLKDNVSIAKKYGAVAISPLYWILNPKSIRKIQSHGLEVYPWTVNKRPFIKRLLAEGVDGIYTNNFPLAQSISKKLSVLKMN